MPTRCELFPIIYQSRRYDATPYAEWLLICSLVNDYFKTFSSQGNILDAAKILPCPDMLAPIKIMIHKSTEWKSEHEWRLMGTFATPALLSEEHTFVKKKASAIYLGRKISPIYARFLLDIAREKRIPVYKTLVNANSRNYHLKPRCVFSPDGAEKVWPLTTN